MHTFELERKMKIIDSQMMRYLSFPDYDIEKIEFIPESKKLKIFIEGAWLDISGGQKLGKGILFFNDWDEIEIKVFDHENKRWLDLDQSSINQLKDICEIKFLDNSLYLYGFDKKSHLWMECKIVGSKMHSEFSEKMKDYEKN